MRCCFGRWFWLPHIWQLWWSMQQEESSLRGYAVLAGSVKMRLITSQALVIFSLSFCFNNVMSHFPLVVMFRLDISFSSWSLVSISVIPWYAHDQVCGKSWQVQVLTENHFMSLTCARLLFFCSKYATEIWS